MTHEGPIPVLMPFRDAEATIVEAAQSILTQRGVEVRLVAIDDGSSDGSARALRDLCDPRVTILRSPGRGIPAALEAGRRAARGPWLARMDADDRSHPDRLARQLAALRRATDVAAMGCVVRGFPDADVGAGMRRYLAWQASLITPAAHRRDIFVEAPLCHPSVLLRREALDAVGGWRDEPWPEDYALWLRLDRAGWGLAKVDETLFEWRRHPGAATRTDPRYGADRFLALRAHFLARRLDGRQPTIWGAGRTGRRLARALEAEGVSARRFVDIDPRKIGRRARGAPIVGPDALGPSSAPIVVAVGAPGAREEVRTRLSARSLVEGEDFVCAA